MFYNYLIFSIVALSLRIFKKYIVSIVQTLRFMLSNNLFQPHETRHTNVHDSKRKRTYLYRETDINDTF